MSCKCKYKFDDRKCNSNQRYNNSGITSCVRKIWIWNPATCSCKNGKYLASFIDDSVTTCDQNTDTTRTVLINFNEKK